MKALQHSYHTCAYYIRNVGCRCGVLGFSMRVGLICAHEYSYHLTAIPIAHGACLLYIYRCTGTRSSMLSVTDVFRQNRHGVLWSTCPYILYCFNDLVLLL